MKENNNQKLKGEIHASMFSGIRADDFCAKVIPNYNPDRFEVIAIRYYEGGENVLTVYALDKSRQENQTEVDTLPVRKFKIENFRLSDLLAFFERFNFTFSIGNFDLDDMDVIGR